MRKIQITISFVLMATASMAQTANVSTPVNDKEATSTEEKEEEKSLSITGSADFYYRADLAGKKSNNLTSFTNSHNAFSLGMASIKLEHKGEKIGAVLDLGFGTRTQEFTYTDAGTLSAIKQLYITYNPADWITFSAGTWATHVGYELLDPQLNKNYSMSYMFTNGPFSHTGVKADVSSGKHGFMIGLSNATDYRLAPDGQVKSKFLIGQYSYAINDNARFYINYVGGKNPDTTKSSLVDFVVVDKLSEKFTLGLNATVNATKSWTGKTNLAAKSWWGAAAYFNVDPSPAFGLTLRSEYFSDKNHLKSFSALSGETIFANTLSLNFKKGGFLFIPELRIENASKDIFSNKNGKATGMNGSFLFATIYSF